MKNRFLILTIFFFITGCGEEDTKQQPKQQETSIYGTWQIKESRVNDGEGSEEVDKVSNGHTITFRKNNTCSRTTSSCQNGGLVNGSFSLGTEYSYNFVEVSFPCSYTNKNGETIKYEEAIKYTYRFKNEYLILSPHYVCDEGCSFKYKRVTE